MSDIYLSWADVHRGWHHDRPCPSHATDEQRAIWNGIPRSHPDCPFCELSDFAKPEVCPRCGSNDPVVWGRFKLAKAWRPGLCPHPFHRPACPACGSDDPQLDGPLASPLPWRGCLHEFHGLCPTCGGEDDPEVTGYRPGSVDAGEAVPEYCVDPWHDGRGVWLSKTDTEYIARRLDDFMTDSEYITPEGRQECGRLAALLRRED